MFFRIAITYPVQCRTWSCNGSTMQLFCVAKTEYFWGRRAGSRESIARNWSVFMSPSICQVETARLVLTQNVLNGRNLTISGLVPATKFDMLTATRMPMQHVSSHWLNTSASRTSFLNASMLLPTKVKHHVFRHTYSGTLFCETSTLRASPEKGCKRKTIKRQQVEVVMSVWFSFATSWCQGCARCRCVSIFLFSARSVHCISHFNRLWEGGVYTRWHPQVRQPQSADALTLHDTGLLCAIKCLHVYTVSPH